MRRMDRGDLLLQLLAGLELGEGSVELMLDPAGLVESLGLDAAIARNLASLSLSRACGSGCGLAVDLEQRQRHVHTAK